MKILKYFLAVILCIFSSELFFGESSAVRYFYTLDLFEDAKMEYQLSLLNSKSVSRYFVPKFDFSGNGSLGGVFGEEYVCGTGSGTVSMSQLLPGFASVSFYFDGELETDQENLFEAPETWYSFTPGISLSIPITGSRKAAGFLNRYGADYSSALREYGNLSYNSALCSGKRQYFEAVAEYLYCSELKEIYSRRKILLEKKIADVEAMYQSGKVSFLSMTETQTQFNDFLEKIYQNESALIEASGILKELKIQEEKLDFSLEEFVLEWKSHFQEQYGIYGNMYFNNQLEILYQDLDLYDKIDDVVSSLPYFSAGFYLNSEEVDEGFPEFNTADWNVTFSLNIPLGSDAVLTSRRIAAYGKTSARQKEKILRRQSVTREQRKSSMNLCEKHCQNLKEICEMEEKRLEVMKSLLQAGKIPEFDLMLQENAVQAEHAEWLSGEIQLVLAMADFY